MAELTPPGFDNMVCPYILTYILLDNVCILVLWAIRSLQPCLIHDRTQCHPGHHRQDGEQLDGVSISVCDLYSCFTDHLV